MPADPLPPPKIDQNTKTNFLTLPRELRQKILHDSLNLQLCKGSSGERFDWLFSYFSYNEGLASAWSATLHSVHPGMKEDVD